MPVLRRIFPMLIVMVFVASLLGCIDGSHESDQPQAEVMPVVFVHGQSGSAQQFETQAMRFTSNNYPQDMLFAFEYNTSAEENPIAALDAFIDAVLVETGASQVYAIGHSRGTSVWTSYLSDPGFTGPDKVAKYVNIDGRSPEQLPGGVPTLGIWGEWNTAGSGFNRRDANDNAQIGPDPDDNYYFPDKSHTETATSAEAFELMYKFLIGIAPETTDVLPTESGTVTVAGRAVFFPENQGYSGSTVQVWEIDSETGQRTSDSPLSSYEIDDSGNFGPVELSSESYYEFALLRAANEVFPIDSVHHFYAEPFTHNNYFLRLQSSRPGGSIEAFIPTQEDSTGLVILRQREFWGDQGAMSDMLLVNGLNVLQPEISPRTGVNLAVFVFDAEGDNITNIDKGELSPFNRITFLTGVDVFIPAMFEGTGTVDITLVTRGGSETRLKVPNWPSASNRISVMFRDDTQ